MKNLTFNVWYCKDVIRATQIMTPDYNDLFEILKNVCEIDQIIKIERAL